MSFTPLTLVTISHGLLRILHVPTGLITLCRVGPNFPGRQDGRARADHANPRALGPCARLRDQQFLFTIFKSTGSIPEHLIHIVQALEIASLIGAAHVGMAGSATWASFLAPQ